uniref:Macrophage-expressed gene 1 protein n=1 Tax=Sinocyclocheilus grahami TaxID=75366 RepID=A0A672L645_SINGR
FKRCPAPTNCKVLVEVLPGGGWDNLQDGIYLIPDEVFVIPQKTSGVETHSETIMSWLEQKSSTSRSINADVSFPSVLNGKFSEENTRMKTHQVRENSVTTRVQVRSDLYTVNAYPDFTLDSRFAQQIGEIADATENNQTHLATYLSEKLILDYGTHVITSVNAGAILVQEDYIKRSYVSNSQSDKSSVSASAGINFFNKVNFNFSSKESQETSETITYQQNITYSLVQSHGGALFYQGITLQKWHESTQNNLVAIDRSGVPLHYFLRDQYRCPPQYSQHLAAISDGCQVLYCVQSGEFTGGQLKPIHLPPFTRPPLVNMMATNTVAVMTEGDRACLRVGETKKWRLSKPGEVNQMVGTFETFSTRMSGGEKAGVACGVMTFIAIVVFQINKLVKHFFCILISVFSVKTIDSTV